LPNFGTTSNRLSQHSTLQIFVILSSCIEVFNYYGNCSIFVLQRESFTGCARFPLLPLKNSSTASRGRARKCANNLTIFRYCPRPNVKQQGKHAGKTKLWRVEKKLEVDVRFITVCSSREDTRKRRRRNCLTRCSVYMRRHPCDAVRYLSDDGDLAPCCSYYVVSVPATARLTRPRCTRCATNASRESAGRSCGEAGPAAG